MAAWHRGGAGRRGLSPVALSVGSGWAEPAQVGADPRAEGQGARLLPVTLRSFPEALKGGALSHWGLGSRQVLGIVGQPLPGWGAETQSCKRRTQESVRRH